MIRTTPDHLVVGLEGPELAPAEAAWLAEHRPCGVILFSRNIINFNQLQSLCRELKTLVPGMEISADHEGGPVSQLAAAVGRPPAAWALGHLDDAGLTARVHEESGRRLEAAGIDRVYAPVADVMTEARNPVIGSRAFGSDPAAVTRHVVAAVTGLLSGGVRVCVKHWPGHGGTDRDTHRESASSGSPDPGGAFRAAVEAGADAVMAGHLHLRARTPAGVALPATLDEGGLRTVRRALAPGSRRAPLVICDDATMGGLGESMEDLGVALPEAEPGGMFPPGDLPSAWLDHLVTAGNDRVLLRGIPWRAFPVAGDAEAPGSGNQGPEPSAVDFDPGPYREARRRLWAVAAGSFADSAGPLIWWDLAAGDRWQVAAGGGDPTEAIRAVLEDKFGSVMRTSEPSGRPTGTRLLVTSHRPLPEGWSAPVDPAPEGVCLVMGHPSLGPDLGSRLGSRWRVGALFDVFAGDLFPDSGEPTKI